MKKILYTFLLISPLLFIYSCEEEVEGCLDANAANYNDNANVDNNSCCYNCYNSINNFFIGEFCGDDVDYIMANGYNGVMHLWALGDGSIVPPYTPEAVPLYDPFGEPVFGNLFIEDGGDIYCN